MMPEGWSRKRIGDFLLESRLQGSNGSNARRLTVKLYGKGVLSKDERRPGSENTKYYKRRAGQLIFSKLDFLNGAFGIIPPELDGYESTLDMPAFDFVGNIAEPSWILRYITRSEFYASQVGLGRGGRKAKRVNPDDFLAIELLMPPLPEQRAIAEILDSVDTTISATEATLAQTRRVKQALLQQLLTKGIDENGRPHTKFKMTEIGEIPEGWEVVQLQSLFSHIVDCLHSTPAYCEMGIPAIRTADVVPGRILVDQCYLVSEESYSERTKRLVPREGDIFYSREGERFGIAAPVPADSRMCLAQRMMHFRAKEGIDSLFALWLLNSRLVYDQATAVASQQTSPHLNIGAIKKFVVRIPPHDEQQAIGKTIDSVTKAERRLEVKIDTCDRLKRALMRDLLTGRVRVRDVKL